MLQIAFGVLLGMNHPLQMLLICTHSLTTALQVLQLETTLGRKNSGNKSRIYGSYPNVRTNFVISKTFASFLVVLILVLLYRCMFSH